MLSFPTVVLKEKKQQQKKHFWSSFHRWLIVLGNPPDVPVLPVFLRVSLCFFTWLYKLLLSQQPFVFVHLINQVFILFFVTWCSFYLNHRPWYWITFWWRVTQSEHFTDYYCSNKWFSTRMWARCRLPWKQENIGT